MVIITRDKVKTYLGISDTSLDAQIDLYIPLVDSITRQIIGGDFESYVVAKTVDASDQVIVTAIEYKTIRSGNYFPDVKFRNGYERDNAGINQPYVIDETASFFTSGQRIEGTGIVADSYITAVDKYSNTLTISANATASGEITAQIGFPIGLEPMVAKMVQWMIDQTNQTTNLKSVDSKTIGPVSVNFGSQDSDIDGRYGAPSWYVKAMQSQRVVRGH